jgi:hypothetical protein
LAQKIAQTGVFASNMIPNGSAALVLSDKQQIARI